MKHPIHRPVPLPLLAAVAGLSLLGASCSSEAASGDAVTLYVALDEAHSKRLIDAWEKTSGITVNARYDTEASKTVGLVSAILEEAANPRCDVFWNNELAQTVRLAQRGMLQPYVSPAAAEIPAQYKDPDGLWTGFAARARVFIVNTDLVPDPADRPDSMWDLLDPRWKGRCAVARPLTGTTLTHFAALRHVLGQEDFERFLDGLVENDVAMLQSNGATMREVSAGSYAFAFTDTDDYHVAQTKGHPVACVFPDQGEGGIGTMLIPNSVAMIAGCPHPEAAKRLIDHVLSKEMEAMLAAAKSAQIPLRSDVPGPAEESILGLGEFRQMQWQPELTATDLAELTRLFEQRFGM